MPAKRKTTAETRAALRRLFAAREEWERNEREMWPPVGMGRTRGVRIVRGRSGAVYRNVEPVVWVLRRGVRLAREVKSQDADPLVMALWDTLPPSERRRSRLFVHCPSCPVRFTKKGAIADALRCARSTGIARRPRKSGRPQI
jgi:hypothetical protein